MNINMKALLQFGENKIRDFKDLPEDLIEEIVLRLPAEKASQVLPFMGLSYLSYFYSRHFNIQMLKGSPKGFMMNYETIHLSKYVIYSSRGEELRVVDQRKDMDVDRIFVGSCSGLLCDVTFNVRLNEIVIQVLNPFLGSSIFVPQPTLPINLDSLDIYGFGCLGSNFKVVRIVQGQDVGLEVYSSMEGRWTQIHVAWPVYDIINNKVVLLDTPLVPLKICFGVSTVCVGRKLHWLIKDNGLDVFRGVLSFDLVKERFEIVKTFSSQDVAEGSWLGLGTLKGDLAVAKENETGGFDVCMIDAGKWERCGGRYPLQPAAVTLESEDDQKIGPFPHMETLLLLGSETMPTAVATLLS